MSSKRKRNKTEYPGVYFVEGISASAGHTERIYYIVYRKKGKQIEEKVGRQFRDSMTATRAARIRGYKVDGINPTNDESRQAEQARRDEEAGRWTISRLWEAYKELNPTLKRLRVDKGLYCNYLKDRFGHKEPHEIISLDVDRLRMQLSKTRKPATVWAALELLKRLVNFGVKRNLCKEMPFYVKMPTINNEKTEDLTSEQMQRLLKAIRVDQSVQARNFMMMVLFTGMRRGELFRLKWDDLDFKNDRVWIRDPKGKKDQAIPMNPDARKLLRYHERPYPESTFVFPGRNGLQRTDIKLQVNRIKKRAKLPKDFRPLHGLRHGLRHVYASMLASSGQVDMYTLQKLLTHKSPQMTQRYAHLRDDTLMKASGLAGDLISRYSKQNKRSKVNILKNR